MNYQHLPSTVIHDIINSYTTCHEQLKLTYMFKQYLYINEQTLATILRSSSQVDLTHLFRTTLRNNSGYIEKEQRLYLKNSTLSWPYVLPKAFDEKTLNKVWSHYDTDLFLST